MMLCARHHTFIQYLMPLLGRNRDKDEAPPDGASQSDDDDADDNIPPRSKSKKSRRGGTKDDAKNRSAKSKSMKPKHKDAETSSDDENTKSKKDKPAKPKQRSSTGRNQINAKKSNAIGRSSTDQRRKRSHSEDSDFENQEKKSLVSYYEEKPQKRQTNAKKKR